MYDCEEIESAANGLGRIERELPDWLQADVAILGEPSGGYIEAGCQGTLRVVVSAAGTRAHSARSWLGDNAIHKLGAVLDRLAAYQARSVDIDGCTYREGLSAVRIDGGIAGNVIPDAASLTVNYRFAPDRSPEQALQHVHEVFDGLDVHIELTDSAAGALPGPDHARRRRARRGRRGTGAREVRLDRRRAVRGAGHPGGQLRTRRPEPRPPSRRACRDGRDHRHDGRAAEIFNRLTRSVRWKHAVRQRLRLSSRPSTRVLSHVFHRLFESVVRLARRHTVVHRPVLHRGRGPHRPGRAQRRRQEHAASVDRRCTHAHQPDRSPSTARSVTCRRRCRSSRIRPWPTSSASRRSSTR